MLEDPPPRRDRAPADSDPEDAMIEFGVLLLTASFLLSLRAWDRGYGRGRKAGPRLRHNW